MQMNKKGEYLAPEVEVMALCIDKDVLIAGSNETLTRGSNSYNDTDFD